jgi:16S rRNA (cytidine1402-2'-O)-methyltransferase
MAELFIVATPIGNMADITYRAVETLKSVEIIACEDTRHTQGLLSRYDIKARLIACHAHNENASAQGIINLLEEGHSVAYVSDAGTPGVSDPGCRLVKAVRAAGFRVTPIPGPSAMATLVSAGGCVLGSFTFEGFLSPKPGRKRKRMEALLQRDEPFIFYESPYRIEKALGLLDELAADRQLTLGREMTKTFEQFLVGTAKEVLAQLPKPPKGEFAVLVHMSDKCKECQEEETEDDQD